MLGEFDGLVSRSLNLPETFTRLLYQLGTNHHQVIRQTVGEAMDGFFETLGKVADRLGTSEIFWLLIFAGFCLVAIKLGPLIIRTLQEDRANKRAHDLEMAKLHAKLGKRRRGPGSTNRPAP